MIVSGIPEENGNKHIMKICSTGLDIMKVCFIDQSWICFIINKELFLGLKLFKTFFQF